MALLKLGGGKDRLARDAVHVDARARLDVVQVDKAKLGHEVNDAVLLGHLHRDGEVIGRFGREEDVHCLFLEGRVAGLLTDLYHMQLLMSAIVPPL